MIDNNGRDLELLRLPQFPRSAAYDPGWVVSHQMGPNVLWLTEWLCEVMELRPGMRVLDLGCGKALSSIFLAREFDVQVWATDLWVSASDNWTRIVEQRLTDWVFPVHADARNLPFADGFFDAIISVDAFEYFGTDAGFLPTLATHVKSGGQIGMVNAGVLREVDVLPAEWPSDFAAFHTPEWWRRHWAISRCVDVDVADHMEAGRELWLRWNDALGEKNDAYVRSAAGKNLGFHRVIARRSN
ncbi:MAG: methyltransferase domain-containing protein [Actinomycetota bacterium]